MYNDAILWQFRHLGIFDLIKSEDEKELASRYDMVNVFDWLNCDWLKSCYLNQTEVDRSDPNKMFQVLLHNTTHSVASSNLLSILHHCLLLPGNRMVFIVVYWKYYQW